MCCIFTCFGWMIDLIQRLWTFVMSCCISSAVCCLLIIASMAGIALGYNYSLAEYIDLKESNVSIFLKRGIFDDEIADLQLRRANDEMNKMSGRRSGQEPTSFDEVTTLKSGRRLDDSVFDAGDQYKYEGSLMKLTAKPPYERTTPPIITEDSEIGVAVGSFTKDTLDSLKAIQSVIDSRRAYAQTIRGPTLSPVPTYPFNEVERIPQQGPMDQQLSSMRRMMQNADVNPSMNPARLAVPNQALGEDVNWVGPLRPQAYHNKFKQLGMEPLPMTFPSPITFNTGPIRPTPTLSTRGEGAVFLTKYNPITLFSTRPTEENEIAPFSKDPNILSFKEKLMAENNYRPLKKHKPSDDDYDYDVKGLPVRRRRSINSNEMGMNSEPNVKLYKENKIAMKDMTTTEKLDKMSQLKLGTDEKQKENNISSSGKMMIFFKQNDGSKANIENTNEQAQKKIIIYLGNITTVVQLGQDNATANESVIKNNTYQELIKENLRSNKTVSSKENAINVILAGNKTQRGITNLNSTERLSIEPILVHMVLFMATYSCVGSKLYACLCFCDCMWHWVSFSKVLIL